MNPLPVSVWQFCTVSLTFFIHPFTPSLCNLVSPHFSVFKVHSLFQTIYTFDILFGSTKQHISIRLYCIHEGHSRNLWWRKGTNKIGNQGKMCLAESVCVILLAMECVLYLAGIINISYHRCDFDNFFSCGVFLFMSINFQLVTPEYNCSIIVCSIYNRAYVMKYVQKEQEVSFCFSNKEAALWHICCIYLYLNIPQMRFLLNLFTEWVVTDWLFVSSRELLSVYANYNGNHTNLVWKAAFGGILNADSLWHLISITEIITANIKKIKEHIDTT